MTNDIDAWHELSALLPPAEAQEFNDCWAIGEQEAGLDVLVSGLLAHDVAISETVRARISVLAEVWGVLETLTPRILRCRGDNSPAPAVTLVEQDAALVGGDPVRADADLAGLVLVPWIRCTRCGRNLMRVHTRAEWGALSYLAEHYAISTPDRATVIRLFPVDGADQAFASLLHTCDQPLRRLFGERRLRRVTDERVLERIFDAPSREILAVLGLPDRAMRIFTLASDFGEGPRTWAEHEAAEPGAIAADRTPGSEGWLVLGRLLYSHAALDPSSGGVWQLPEVGGPPRPVNRSLHDFVAFLCAFEEAVQACDHERGRGGVGLGVGVGVDEYREFCTTLGEKLEARLRAVDPEALDDEERVWASTLFEISEGMW